MSAVFYADEAQRTAIEQTRKLYVGEDQVVHTEVAALKRFWIAEDYHQKYRLRHEPELYDELRALYPEEEDFVNSTAAARINGFLDGHASARRLAVRVGGALVCFQIDFPQDRPADWWRDPACASRHHHPLARAGAGQAGEGD